LLALPALDRTVRRARLLRDGAAVRFEQRAGGLILELPARPADLIDEIVALDVESR
jgi:hypothetical protein